MNDNHCKSVMSRLIRIWQENEDLECLEQCTTQAAEMLLSTLRSFRSIENRYRAINIHQSYSRLGGETPVVS